MYVTPMYEHWNGSVFPVVDAWLYNVRYAVLNVSSTANANGWSYVEVNAELNAEPNAEPNANVVKISHE